MRFNGGALYKIVLDKILPMQKTDILKSLLLSRKDVLRLVKIISE
jgi:hypothetical protein